MCIFLGYSETNKAYSVWIEIKEGSGIRRYNFEEGTKDVDLNKLQVLLDTGKEVEEQPGSRQNTSETPSHYTESSSSQSSEVEVPKEIPSEKNYQNGTWNQSLKHSFQLQGRGSLR